MSGDGQEYHAGRELDALIAEKVMGYRWQANYRYRWQANYLVSTDEHTDAVARRDEVSGELIVLGVYGDWLPKYSTDIAAAWLVVERVQSQHRGWRFMLIGGDASYPGTWHRDRAVITYDESRLEPFGWRAEFFGHHDPRVDTGERHGTAQADTPALAICRAALAAIAALEPSHA